MAMPVTNDEQKFTRLYNEYYKYVFGIASKFFENNMDKEDAVYTSFLKISFNISKVKDIYSRETKAFVATITRNTCITLLNKKNKIKEIYIENLNEIPDDTDGFETLEEEQLLVTYKSGLKKLTKNQYDILYLRYAKNNLIMVEQKNESESQFTQYYYDVNNRVIRIYSGLSKPLTVNGADNVLPNGDDEYSVIKYTYDFYGNKSSYTDNHNKTEKYEYNEYSGTLTNVTKRDGTKVSYTYDVQGNVLTETAEKAGKDNVKKTYTYDYDNNKQTAVISKKSVNSDKFVDEYKITYNNNENGAVYNEKTENFKTENVINKAYQYDDKGNKTKLTVSKIVNGTKTEMYSYSYTYYDDGKLETEKHIVAGATEQPVIKYTYDNNGNVVSKVLSNGSEEDTVKVTSSYTYNLANECVTEVHNNGTGYNYEYSYTYNPDGNISESTLSKNGKRIRTVYTYDRLNRLTSEEQKEYNENGLSDEFKDEYTFDDYNNILKTVHTENNSVKNTVTTNNYNKTYRENYSKKQI